MTLKCYLEKDAYLVVGVYIIHEWKNRQNLSMPGLMACHSGLCASWHCTPLESSSLACTRVPSVLGRKHGLFLRSSGLYMKLEDVRSLPEDVEEPEQQEKLEAGKDSNLFEALAEKIEFGVQTALAVVLLGALGLSCANVLAKIGVITFALVSVSVRYTIVGILLVVLVACVL